MLRVIALVLSLILSLGVIIPLMTNSSEASQARSALLKKKSKKKRGWKGVKKYSKRWWQLYRRQERRKKSLAARKQALQDRQEMLAKQREENGGTPISPAGKSGSTFLKENSASALLPTGDTAPKGWKQSQSTSSEVQYRVDDNGGKTIGEASITVVGPATESDAGTTWLNRKTLGGVSTSALRRTVIDQMMKEGGWVVNDYQKSINDKKVFVVVAQSKNSAGQLQARLFYFTEVEGKIYSVSTKAPDESSERLAQESERVVNSLQRGGSRATQAGLR